MAVKREGEPEDTDFRDEYSTDMRMNDDKGI